MSNPTITQEHLLSALKTVLYMPKSNNIVDLGMVKDIQIQDNSIRFSIEIGEKNEKLTNVLKQQSIKAIKTAFGEGVNISEDDIDIVMPNANSYSTIKNTIAVASGKGGVGKSTIAVNLAVSLAKQGFKVGLLDADIYGPSIPTMLKLEEGKAEGFEENGKQFIKAFEQYGIKTMSIGFFVEPEKALLWRGPMASGAVQQIYQDTVWEDLDYMVIDLPPGTGDIHLTLVQTLPLTAAIVVTTPQKVALADAVKAVAMFQQKDINVPVLGIVENMSWFTPEELPDNKYYIFGKDGADALAKDANVPVLGKIPLVQSVREGGDSGEPIAIKEDHLSGQAFREMAKTVHDACEKRNREQAPTQRLEVTKKGHR